MDDGITIPLHVCAETGEPDWLLLQTPDKTRKFSDSWGVSQRAESTGSVSTTKWRKADGCTSTVDVCRIPLSAGELPLWEYSPSRIWHCIISWSSAIHYHVCSGPLIGLCWCVLLRDKIIVTKTVEDGPRQVKSQIMIIHKHVLSILISNDKCTFSH